MKKSISWESLAWLVVWVVILSFTLLWMINIINFSKDAIVVYTSTIWKYILDWNANNIAKKVDISWVLDWETFYLYKDTTNKIITVFTWASNEEYKYISSLWEKIDPIIYQRQKFTREFTKQADILKHVIQPDEISNLVFWFDANNLDWTNNSTYTHMDLIDRWTDLSGNWNHADQSNSSYQPMYVTQWYHWSVSFNWINQRFELDHNEELNNDEDCYADFAYEEKSFAIVLKTWMDVTSDQVIFEQWWEATWYNFMIHDWDLYAWIHNKADDTYSCTDFSATDTTFQFPWDSWLNYKSVNLWEVLIDSAYFIMIVQDSSHASDSNNTLKIYMNWLLASETDHIDPQPEHHLAWIWSVNERNVRPRDTNPSTNTIKSWDWQGWCDDQCLFFGWYLWEFISWNYALSPNEIKWIENYFEQKWLETAQSIWYNTIDININNYNQ